MRDTIGRIFLALGLMLAGPGSAQEVPRLGFPLACTLGETCFVQQGVDRDPGPGAQDFRCGPQTYDGHSGTDIRVPHMSDLDDGVAVLAAAAGRVLGSRNGVADLGVGNHPEGQDCGNGLLIDHGNGWQTQYCHLAQGSVSVATGQQVEAGQQVGTMGFSGNTAFPHLHFVVRQNGTNIDPFAPGPVDTCGGDQPPALWAEPVAFPTGGFLAAGFSDAIPDYPDVQSGAVVVEKLSRSSEALVFWVYYFGSREGDTMRLSIATPDGDIWFDQDVELDRTQAEAFRAGGRRVSEPLAPGLYSGTADLIRGGQSIATITTTIPVD